MTRQEIWIGEKAAASWVGAKAVVHGTLSETKADEVMLVIHEVPNREIAGAWPIAGFQVKTGPLTELFAEQASVGWLLSRIEDDD